MMKKLQWFTDKLGQLIFGKSSNRLLIFLINSIQRTNSTAERHGTTKLCHHCNFGTCQTFCQQLLTLEQLWGRFQRQCNQCFELPYFSIDTIKYFNFYCLSFNFKPLK